MWVLGSTVFPTHPAYSIDGVYVPRPNTHFRKGTRGWKVTRLPWFRKFAEASEAEVLRQLGKHERTILQRVMKFKRVCPEFLRVSGTIFNAVAFVGDLGSGNNHKHVDRNDLCSIIITLGDNNRIHGGTTIYWTEDGKEKLHEERFTHGKFQTGSFDKVLHSGEVWDGPRVVVSFYLNRGVCEHLEKHGMSLIEKMKKIKLEF